ncbi:MAG: hypothetical protein ACLFQ9_04480 [Desulfobacterales bacterium]
MKIMYKAVLCTALAVIFVAAGSCGKKGPPEPPGETRLPVAKDLEIEQTENSLLLKWSLPEIRGSEMKKPAGFIVYRAVTLINQDCPECPVRFERAGWVAYRSGRNVPETWYFEDTPADAGQVYRYRVKCYNDDGSLGEASETVKHTIGGQGDD